MSAIMEIVQILGFRVSDTTAAGSIQNLVSYLHMALGSNRYCPGSTSSNGSCKDKRI